MRFLWVLLVATTVAMPARASARAPAHPSLCGIGLRSHEGRVTCFPPSQVSAAERKLPVHPIRPASAVRAVAHLKLTQVELAYAQGPFGINYLFGYIPADDLGGPVLGASSPHYVLVGENVGRIPGLRVGTTATSVTNGKTYVYWTFEDNFRCRNLTFQVTSNISRRVPKQIGREMAAAEGCGAGKG